MEVTGKLVKILDLEEGTSKAGKSWQKQSVVIDTGGEFNNLTAVSAFGDKVDKLNRLELGMDVSILCNVYSREYQGKYYHNIDGYHFTDQSASQGDPGDENSPF
jgi:hypothetical protein|tara:strand:- start:273 stop:584 length:312 start_codon:yes stop_codon:yes gene_type:complete